MSRQQIEATPTFAKLQPQILAADTIFASFPKSGRTWVRFVLQHYAALRHGQPFDVRPRTVSGFAKHSRAFFTEDYFDYVFDEPGEPFVVYAPEMRDRALIVLVRDPRDTIISQYHWTVKHRQVSDLTLEDFIRSPIYGAERMSNFVGQLLDTFDQHAGDKHLLSYSRCWTHPHEEFRKLLTFLDGDRVDLGRVDEAVDKSAFEQMQKLEIEVSEQKRVGEFRRIGVTDWNGDLNALKVRRGGLGAYLDEAPWMDTASDLPLTRALVVRLAQY